MPTNIRPLPRSTLLNYPKPFDPEMDLQLREKNLATLEKMQNIAKDVEANLLITSVELKAKERDNIDAENLTSLGVKLNILVSAMEEMMQKVITRNKYDVQDHGSLIEEKNVGDPKYFLSYPSCHRYDNDCLIYHLVEERYVDLTCMLDDILYMDDLPKFDQYDDDYVLQTKANLADQSVADLWEEEIQFQ